MFEAYTFESAYIENKGNGKFIVTPLPASVQFSRINTSIADDFNGDGNLDVFVVGNFYPINIQMGRYDASFGSLLQGDGKGKFKIAPNKDSCIQLQGEIRKLGKVKVDQRMYYIDFRNNDSPVSFSIKQ